MVGPPSSGMSNSNEKEPIKVPILLQTKNGREFMIVFIVKVLEYAEKQRLEAEKREEKVDELARQLARYIPPQIHSALMAGNYSTEVATRRKKLTIFFSDIKNFTSTSEGLQPEDLTKYLNEYFSEMTQIAIETKVLRLISTLETL